MIKSAACLVLAATLFVPSNLFGQNDDKVVTIDHFVRHTSTVPANAGDVVQLFLRERLRDDEKPGKAVLMVHGRSVPILPGMDLRHDDYSWAFRLAKAGFDVFMLDFQGSGLSTRPKMDDPCNVNPAQRSILTPNPLSVPCPAPTATYAAQLINIGSDWGELNTVIDYIREYRGVDKVALVSWSEGAFRVGPYAIQHP